MPRILILSCLALGLLLAPASAEIYKWVDGSGQTHYTGDLSQVPPDQRPSAKQGAEDQKTKPSKIQTFNKLDKSSSKKSTSSSSSSASSGIHKIRVQKASNAMFVRVSLNDSVSTVLHVDTGASYVVITAATARELEVTIDENTPRITLSTANGFIRQPLVMLESVQVGSARVDNVQAVVSDTMGNGLLGLSFFNSFNYSIDSENGLITLKENQLGSSGKLKGGRTQEQWSNEFRNRREQLRWIEDELSEIDSTNGHKLQRYREGKAKLEKELEALEGQADRAGVPDRWRY